jgi:hypothetical protein
MICYGGAFVNASGLYPGRFPSAVLAHSFLPPSAAILGRLCCDG